MDCGPAWAIGHSRSSAVASVDSLWSKSREILQAMRFAYERLKLVIEPSSAVALAPLLRKEVQLKGKRTAVVLTGGNTDLSLLWNGLREEISR